MQTAEEILKEEVIKFLIEKEGLTKEKAIKNYEDSMKDLDKFMQVFINSMKIYGKQIGQDALNKAAKVKLLRSETLHFDEFHQGLIISTPVITP